MKKNQMILKKEKIKVFKKFFKTKYTGILMLEDGTEFYGYGFGHQGHKVGELCFNTSITGYQEILTDPSYDSQIIVFTFPHIGNIGINNLDNESKQIFAFGLITREEISKPSNWRSLGELNDWLIKNKIPAISGIDTRYLTKKIRSLKAPKALLAFNPKGVFQKKNFKKRINDWKGLNNLDLSPKVSTVAKYKYKFGIWDSKNNTFNKKFVFQKHIIALDYGIKQNILRYFNENNCKVTVLPYNTNFKKVLNYNPDGLFLSNGPGDPFATSKRIGSNLNKLIDFNIPIFGICLGHQILAILLGAKTKKMAIGHRGSNHPVINLNNNKVEITSQNHGFVVEEESLPDNLQISHKSLFDGSIEGIKHKEKNIFSVQFHPEASPGPKDSAYLFENFMNNII